MHKVAEVSGRLMNPKAKGSGILGEEHMLEDIVDPSMMLRLWPLEASIKLQIQKSFESDNPAKIHFRKEDLGSRVTRPKEF